MPIEVEYLLVTLIVAAAAFALAVKLVRFARGGKPGCGSGCGDCDTKADAIRQGTLKPLVQLQPPSRRDAGR